MKRRDKKMMIIKDRLYNAEVKIRYLDTFENETSKEIISYPFLKSRDTEEEFNKDIYEMNELELGGVLTELKASTEYSAYNYTTKLEHYIDWAIENGYRKNNINPLTLIDKKEWSKQYVAKYRQSVFSREQILEMCEGLANWTDRAILLGLFEGISGEGYNEILNMRTKDITETENGYEVKLYDKDGKSRTIQITDQLAKFLYKADEQTHYENKNGTSEGRQALSPFVESELIFKKSARGKQEGSLDLFFINRKFQMFKELFEHKYLKPRDIIRSGMMNMAHELYQKDGEAKTEHLREIGDHYNTTLMTNTNKRNITVVRNIIESDLFEQIYDYEIKYPILRG